MGEKHPIWSGLTAPGEVLPLVFALMVCAGAVVYLLLPFEPTIPAVTVLAIGVAATLWWIVTGQADRILRIGLILTAGLGLGIVAGKIRATTMTSPSIEMPVGPVMVEGWVSAVEPATRGVRLRIRPHAIAGMAKDKVPDEIRLTHRLDLKVAPGRFVRCWSVLRPPPGPAVPGDYDFHRQAWFDGLGAVGYVQGRCRGGVLGPPERLTTAMGLNVSALRRQLAQYTFEASGERAGGFAAALVSGDRSYMPAADQENLRASGLAHLLAISGLHLGIVGGLVYFLFRQGLAFIAPISLRFPVQKPAAIAALIAITAYLVISGASVSTQRAFIMSAVFFMAILIDRPALSLRSFSIAMLAVVLLAPESVLAPGFQMSFAATGVLIAIYEGWARRRSRKGISVRSGLWQRGVFATKSLAVTSIAASFATAPFALFHFERLAPLGLVANLLAMPVVSLASVPSAGLAMLLAPFGEAGVGLKLFGMSLEMVLVIAEWSSHLGASLAYPLKAMSVAALAAYTCAMIAIIALRRWLRPVAILTALALGSAFWAFSPVPDVYWSPSGEVYINHSGGQYVQVAFTEGDALGPLRLGNAETGAPCTSGTCEYETARGARILLVHEVSTTSDCQTRGDDLLVLAVRIAEHVDTTPCHTLIGWGEIAARGGVAIRLGATGIERRHAHTCSERPWRKCS